MIEIDGSAKNAGGQVLRTALSLSAVLRKPFHIAGIRANRPNPGMQAQHLAALEATAEITHACATGAAIGSSEATFEPDGIFGGEFSFDVSARKPSAGSAILVFQTVLAALSLAKTPSKISIAGGTHVSWSPCFEYIAQSFLPAAGRLGIGSTLALTRSGFYPAGGGLVKASVSPAELPLKPLAIETRPSLSSVSGVCVVSGLPLQIAERMKTSCLTALAGLKRKPSIKTQETKSASPGAYAFLAADYGGFAMGFSALGERGKPAEKVGQEAVAALVAFDSSKNAVEARLADQIMLYCALARGESRLKIGEPSDHVKANAEVIRAFLPECRISFDGGLMKIRGTGITRERFA